MQKNRKESSLHLANSLGRGNLEEGAMEILRGTHWENNYQHLLGVLELHGPKFFTHTYPSEVPPATRSYMEYEKFHTHICEFLTADEKTVLDNAFTGKSDALIDLLSHCPEYLLFQELTNHVINLLRDAQQADRGHIKDYQDLLRKLIPSRPGGKRSLVEEDIQSAFIVLYELYQKDKKRLQGEHGPAELARERIANEFKLPVSAIIACTKGILPRGAPSKPR